MMTRRKLGVVVAIAVIILALFGGYVFWATKQSPESISRLSERVGRHYLLPDNETPALLTVEDKSKVNSNFFEKAHNGDKVLVYKDNKLVILYRPSIDRIIQVGPVSMAEMK